MTRYVKPIFFELETTVDEELDDAIYGRFYLYSRYGKEPGVYVQTERDGEWIPVRDWTAGKYDVMPEDLRRIARHFIELGRQVERGEWLKKEAERYEKER